MKEKSNKNKARKYYLLGFLTLFISIIFISLGITMPLIDKNNQIYGWLGLIFTCIGLISLGITTYFLKKGSFLNLNENIKKSREEFIADLEKLSDKWDKNSNNDKNNFKK